MLQVKASDASGYAIPSANNQHQQTTSNGHQVLVWIGSAVAIVLLWQIKGVHPFLLALLAIIVLGMLLKNLPTISSQFAQLN